MARVVFLTFPSSCNGFRIGNHVVTALHCLGNGRVPNAVAAHMRTASSPREFELEEIWPLSRTASATRQDAVVLRIKGGYPGASDAEDLRWLGEPRLLDRLILPQSNIYVRTLLGKTEQDAFAKSVRLEHNPGCRAYSLTDDGIILHSCQTERGTSGAPLLQRLGNGRIAFVGVHHGALDAGAGAMSACRKIGANYGMRLPIDAIRSAIERRTN